MRSIRIGLLCEECLQVFEIQPCFARPFCSLECYRLSVRFTPARFWARVDKRGPNECWPWLGGHDNGDGYGRAFDGERTRQAHDVAWELANRRKLPKGKVVRHSCDNPPCCNPQHLLKGTPLDNVRDAIERGRNHIPYVHSFVPLHRRPRGKRNGMHTHPESRLRGERSGNCKLTRVNVRRMRRLRQKKHTYASIACKFGISISQVFRITQGESWSWL